MEKSPSISMLNWCALSALMSLMASCSDADTPKGSDSASTEPLPLVIHPAGNESAEYEFRSLEDIFFTDDGMLLLVLADRDRNRLADATQENVGSEFVIKLYGIIASRAMVPEAITSGVFRCSLLDPEGLARHLRNRGVVFHGVPKLKGSVSEFETEEEAIRHLLEPFR